MTNQSSPITQPFEPLLEANYEILFFDANYDPVLVASWDVRTYSLAFNEYATTLQVNITGLTNIYDLQLFRQIKYIKLRYLTNKEKFISDYSFEVWKMSGTLQGGYNSYQLLSYLIQFSVK
jgi:hypothetical protein